MSVILRTNHLTKRYGHRTVVDNLSMTIHEGDIYGFIGKNGAGKTTLIRMITGLAAPSDGNLLLFGSSNLLEGRKQIGTVIESPALYPGMTARENLITQCKLQGVTDESQADSILTLIGLSDTGKKRSKISHWECASALPSVFLWSATQSSLYWMNQLTDWIRKASKKSEI